MLFDPDGAMDRAGLDHRHTHYVLEEGARVYALEAFRDNGFETALDELLSR